MLSTEYDEYRSGRQTVFKFLAENPHHSFASIKKRLCEETVLDELKDQTIRNYMSEWRRTYSRFGMVPRLHRGFGVLESGFDASLWKAAPHFGWRVSRNKNHERLWRESGISLGWHRNGTVVFRFKGSRPQGHLLAAFVHAFLDLLLSTGKSESGVLSHLHATFGEGYRTRGFHSTYETGQPLPKIVVKDLEKSHGITIKLGDGSHPTSLEVEQREPFWFSKIENVIDKLGVQIESHLALIQSWREESVENRRASKQLTFRFFEFLQQLEKRDRSNDL